MPQALEACGHAKEFAEFFEGHAFKPHILQDEERIFLKKCMRYVFRFADEEFGFAAPGLYKRFSKDYVDAGLSLGYRCGYRTQEMFTYFSLSIWLIHVEEVEDFRAPAIFRCLGDQTIKSIYHPDSLVFGVARFVDALLYYHAVFENWADVQRYIRYDRIVGENRRREVCQYIVESPHEDETFNKEVWKQNSCDDFLFLNNYKEN